MPKRILSQTLRRSRPSATDSHAEQLSAWSRIRDILVTLGTTSGVLTAVLWFGGRVYAYGYFERMGIPLFFLNFQFGEYAENYVSSVVTDIVFYFITNFFLLIKVIIVTIFIYLVLREIQKRYKKLKIWEAITKIEIFNRKFLVAYAILLFFLSFVSAYRHGSISAYHSLTRGTSINVYSKDFLPLGSYSTVTTPDKNSFLYEFGGLYLITYNSGKYYFFRELDTNACKPKEIYVVSDSDVISVNMSDLSGANFTCSNPPE